MMVTDLCLRWRSVLLMVAFELYMSSPTFGAYTFAITVYSLPAPFVLSVEVSARGAPPGFDKYSPQSCAFSVWGVGA